MSVNKVVVRDPHDQDNDLLSEQSAPIFESRDPSEVLSGPAGVDSKTKTDCDESRAKDLEAGAPPS